MENLRRIRQEQHLSMRELSERSGVSLDSIFRLESGQREPRQSTLRKLAAALGVEPSDLYEDGIGGMDTAALRELVRARSEDYQRAKSAGSSRDERHAHNALMAAVSELVQRPDIDVEEAFSMAVAS